VEEVWKAYTGRYAPSGSGYLVSSYGRIRSPFGLIAGSDRGEGYLRINLKRPDGTNKTAFVHVMVAEMFIPRDESDKSLEVNHKEGDKQNNAANMLEWVTPAEHRLHTIASGLNSLITLPGILNSEAVLTDSAVLEIKEALLKPQRGLKAALARRFGVHRGTISQIANGNNWKHLQLENKGE
jgi:hypothetical protein